MKKPVCLIAASLLLLAGCGSVGPNYAGPPQAAINASRRGTFLRAEASSADAGLPQSAWWRALGDAKLDVLVETALAANTDAVAAVARLAAARAALGQARTDQLPTGSIKGSYARTKPSFAQFGVLLPGVQPRDLDLYQADFDASWEIDLFGGRRRAVESAVNRAQAASADVDDVRLSVAADTAQAYLDLRDQQAGLAVLEQSSKIDDQLVALTRERQSEGAASTLDLERIDAQREATLGEMPTVEANIVAEMDRLSILTGQEPGALDATLSAPSPIPMPPAKVSVGDPAGLIRRRPDIRAAERRLAANNAAIGVATADLFPKVTLNGDIGLAANDIGKFATSGSFYYSIGPSISWSVFNLPRVHAEIHAAQARRDESLAQIGRASCRERV